MIAIRSGEHKAIINGSGNLVGWSDSPYISHKHPAFLVLFKDHSRIDPLCKSMDLSSPVDMIQIGNPAVYSKKVDKLNLTCTVTISDVGLDWEIVIDSTYPANHRLGLAMPCLSGDMNSMGQKTHAKVLTYNRFFQTFYRDQEHLKVPMITINNDSCMSVFGDILTNYQFFSYEDDISYVRTTVSTTFTNVAKISFRIHSHESQSRQLYVDTYPDADSFINKWKKSLSKLEHKHGLIINHSPAPSGNDDLTFDPPTEQEVESFIQIVSDELDKYPAGFFETIRMHGIWLCKNLKEADKNFLLLGTVQSGTSDKVANWVFLDIEKPLKWLIHHEIFHLIEELVELDSWPAGRIDLFPRAQRPIYFLSKTTLSEHRANMFADIMSRPDFINQISDDEIVQSQIHWIKDKIDNLSPINWPISQRDVNDLDETRTVIAIHENGDVREITFGTAIENIVEYRATDEDNNTGN